MGIKEKEVADLTMALHKAKEKKTANLLFTVMLIGAGCLVFFVPLLTIGNHVGDTNEEILERMDKVNEFTTTSPDLTISGQYQSFVVVGLMCGLVAVLCVWGGVANYQNDFKKYNEQVFELQTKYNELIK